MMGWLAQPDGSSSADYSDEEIGSHLQSFLYGTHTQKTEFSEEEWEALVTAESENVTLSEQAKLCSNDLRELGGAWSADAEKLIKMYSDAEVSSSVSNTERVLHYSDGLSHRLTTAYDISADQPMSCRSPLTPSRRTPVFTLHEEENKKLEEEEDLWIPSEDTDGDDGDDFFEVDEASEEQKKGA